MKIPLTLPDFIAAFLENHPTGAFFDNMDAMKLIRKANSSASNSEDAFEEMVHSIYRSESQVGKNAIRWVYLMLCVYDVF